MTNSIDQQFIEYVVKSLVSNPDAVKIERRIDEKGVLLELTVDDEDLGRVIGKRGATAQSLRTLLRALGTKNDARYNLKIVDNGRPAPSHDRDERREDEQSSKPFSSDSSSSNDSTSSDDQTEEPIQNDPIADEPDEDEVDAAVEPKQSDSLAKTRQELDDLDDLDI